MKLTTPQEVVDYWFGESRKNIDDLDVIKQRMGLWFGRASPEFDAIQTGDDHMVLYTFIRLTLFIVDVLENAALIDALLEDTCDKSVWKIDSDPQAALAKVIVLDQFSRSVHRGTARAFAGDEICASLIRDILEASKNTPADNESDNKYPETRQTKADWFFGKYSPVERFFLIVSIQHSEIFSNQALGVQYSSSIGHGCSNPEIGAYFLSLKGFPMEHHDVIQRFGRFPHRNDLLVS
jgi:uncharacterized protein (DUF924 family)